MGTDYTVMQNKKCKLGVINRRDIPKPMGTVPTSSSDMHSIFCSLYNKTPLKKKKVSIVSFQSSCNSTSFRLLLYSNKMTFVKVSHDLHTANLMVSSQSSPNLTAALNVVNLSFLLKNDILLATRTPQTPVIFFPLAN